MQYNTMCGILYNAIQYYTLPCDIIQYDTLPCNSPIPYNAIKHNTILHGWSVITSVGEKDRGGEEEEEVISDMGRL